MVQVTDQTPHEGYTVQGLTFQMPQPYTTGTHELTEGEASQLNQVLAENLRNNFAAKIRAKLDAYIKANNLPEGIEPAVDVLDKDELDTEFAEYAAKYEFGVRQAGAGGPRAPADPVGKEAYKIAWERIKGALAKKNIKLDSVSKEKRAELIDQTLAKYPAIREEAERRVNAVAEIAIGEIDAPQVSEQQTAA